MERKSFKLREINQATEKKFKSFLKTLRPSDTAYIHIESWGGNSWYGKKMEGYLYYLKRYHSCRFVIRATIAASAAFRIFIRGDERIITKHSIIQPHLSVPNIAYMDPQTTAREQESDLKFITATIPALTREDIIKYNDMSLPFKMLVQKKVVTKVVERL